MTIDWQTHYRDNWAHKLNINFTANRGRVIDGMYNRAMGFDLMFMLMLKHRSKDFDIIETGTTRTPDNWTDGQSAFLFTKFVDWHGGRVRSVDIDPEACAAAKSLISSEKFSVDCSDSVVWLKQQTDLAAVDLFYLDSWDVVWEDDVPSAEHHLKEFLIIEPYLKPGAVVVVDDNTRWCHNQQRTGKGRRVFEYLEAKNHLPIYDQYQIVWQF
jgi:predicted O-methyltransferase YrrM